MPLLALATACAAAPDARSPLLAALEKAGFSRVAAERAPGPVLSRDAGQGLRVTILLPPPPPQDPAPMREVVAVIKVQGPGGAQGPAQDQVFRHNPDLHQALALASRGMYPPAAAAEILAQALDSPHKPGESGALITSPKQGYALAVMIKDGHLAQVAVLRYPKRF
ncbi:MAG: hypothetical protein AB1814_18380 [Thermodesulfobacteriota bacterium]